MGSESTWNSSSCPSIQSIPSRDAATSLSLPTQGASGCPRAGPFVRPVNLLRPITHRPPGARLGHLAILVHPSSSGLLFPVPLHKKTYLILNELHYTRVLTAAELTASRRLQLNRRHHGGTYHDRAACDGGTERCLPGETNKLKAAWLLRRSNRTDTRPKFVEREQSTHASCLSGFCSVIIGFGRAKNEWPWIEIARNNDASSLFVWNGQPGL